MTDLERKLLIFESRMQDFKAIYDAVIDPYHDDLFAWVYDQLQEKYEKLLEESNHAASDTGTHV